MTFLKTRSGDFVVTPPRVYNIRGGGARDRQCIRFKTYSHPEFKLYYDLFLPFTSIPRRRPEKNGFLIIFIKACKSTSLLVHGRPGKARISPKIELMFFRRTLFTRTLFGFILALILWRTKGKARRLLVQTLKDHFEISATIQNFELSIIYPVKIR